MVNLSDIQEINRRELLRCLRKFDSPISLIWDPNLTAPFTLFSDIKLLQEYGVEKMVALPESGRLAGTGLNIWEIFRDFRRSSEIFRDLIFNHSQRLYNKICGFSVFRYSFHYRARRKCDSSAVQHRISLDNRPQDLRYLQETAQGKETGYNTFYTL